MQFVRFNGQCSYEYWLVLEYSNFCIQCVIIFHYTKNSIVMISPNCSEYDTQSLYQEFLTYIKGQQKKSIECNADLEYKKLFSDLRKSNDYKKQRLEQTQSKELYIRSSGCKFTKIQGYRQLGTLKDSYIKCQSRVAAETDKQNIEDQILMEESQRSQLQEEIDNYKVSMGRMTKEISKVKNQIKLLDLQENKFMEAHHLANNIVQFTEQFSIVNVRNYHKMLQQQEQTLSKLKKMRTQAKNQLAETQFQFQVQQKQHDVKYKKMIKSSIPLQIQDQTSRKSNKFSKGLKKFIQAIESVLSLLQGKESNYQLVKQEQCTKLASKKFDIELLPADRVEWIKIVEQFQQKFEIRVQSTDKLLVKLFKQIKSSNDEIEKRILQLQSIYEDNQQQYKALVKKSHNIEEGQNTNQSQNNQKQKQIDKKFKQVHQKSSMFVQIMQLINSLLIKFRYIFKIFIMMNIDKRKLSDHLLKLDEVLDSKNIFAGCRLSDSTHGSGNLNNQDTNAQQMYEIFMNVFKDVDSKLIQQTIFLFFNDFRAALIWRKTMVIEQLQQCKDKTDFQEFIKILQTVRSECQHSYNEKLKSSFKILFQCLKSISKNSQSSTNRSYPRYSNQIKNSILSSQLYFLPGMFPKSNIPKNEQQDDDLGLPDSGKWLVEYILNTKQKQKMEEPQQWGIEEKKNPSAMIRKLAGIRNQSSKKFKLLDLHEPQKKYIKSSMKLNQIALNGCINLITNSSESKSQQTNNQQNESKNYYESKSRTKIQQSPQMNRTNSGGAQLNNFLKE